MTISFESGVGLSLGGRRSPKQMEIDILPSSMGGSEGMVAVVGSGDREVRDSSESEAPNKSCASAFFFRVALEVSGSVEELVTTSVSVPGMTVVGIAIIGFVTSEVV